MLTFDTMLQMKLAMLDWTWEQEYALLVSGQPKRAGLGSCCRSGVQFGQGKCQACHHYRVLSNIDMSYSVVGIPCWLPSVSTAPLCCNCETVQVQRSGTLETAGIQHGMPTTRHQPYGCRQKRSRARMKNDTLKCKTCPSLSWFLMLTRQTCE